MSERRTGGRIHDKELLSISASQDKKRPIDPTDVAAASSALAGLNSEKASRLLAQYGENAIQERRASMLRKFLLYFWGPIPWKIEITALRSSTMRHWENFPIIVVMLLNADEG